MVCVLTAVLPISLMDVLSLFPGRWSDDVTQILPKPQSRTVTQSGTWSLPWVLWTKTKLVSLCRNYSASLNLALFFRLSHKLCSRLLWRKRGQNRRSLHFSWYVHGNRLPKWSGILCVQNVFRWGRTWHSLIPRCKGMKLDLTSFCSDSHVAK